MKWPTPLDVLKWTGVGFVVVLEVLVAVALILTIVQTFQ